MANNRLYIVDTETGEHFMLAKSMGRGWYIRGENPGEPSFAERFEAWCDERDFEASYQNCGHCKPTKFRLVCEEDEEWGKWASVGENKG